jgi:hypothetical protein
MLAVASGRRHLSGTNQRARLEDKIRIANRIAPALRATAQRVADLTPFSLSTYPRSSPSASKATKVPISRRLDVSSFVSGLEGCEASSPKVRTDDAANAAGRASSLARRAPSQSTTTRRPAGWPPRCTLQSLTMPRHPTSRLSYPSRSAVRCASRRLPVAYSVQHLAPVLANGDGRGYGPHPRDRRGPLASIWSWLAGSKPA